MEESNTILEFIGILIIAGILLTLLAVIIQIISEKAINKSKSKTSVVKTEESIKLKMRQSSNKNIIPNPMILRNDGYYLAYIKGNNYLGEIISAPIAFIFTKMGLVIQYQGDDAIELINTNLDDFRQALIEINLLDEYKTTNETSKYYIQKNVINMSFYEVNSNTNSHLLIDPISEPTEYIEWVGEVLFNGLLLKAYKSSYNYAMKEYMKDISINELRFDFIQIIFK